MATPACVSNIFTPETIGELTIKMNQFQRLRCNLSKGNWNFCFSAFRKKYNGYYKFVFYSEYCYAFWGISAYISAFVTFIMKTLSNAIQLVSIAVTHSYQTEVEKHISETFKFLATGHRMLRNSVDCCSRDERLAIWNIFKVLKWSVNLVTTAVANRLFLNNKSRSKNERMVGRTLR